ncbi:hypothetical protein F5Y12DRAFT_726492 [Xylaria sp. FL1777]|nr:hypothetical protein F5Y12DRAFT_726492 [Xylaria sp. FL1777]
MSTCIYSCVFCGWFICDEPGVVSWANQFRGLYEGPTGIVLTGVGLYDDPREGHFIAPTNSNARWDDKNYDRPPDDEFGAIDQGERNGRHGFIFHDACWRLLEKALAGRARSAPLERLFRVLSSLPILRGTSSFSWGHDFNDDAHPAIRPHHLSPWDDGFDESRFSEPIISCIENPYDAAEADQILAATPQLPPKIAVTIPSVGMLGNDLLSKLPLELRLAVNMHLSISDLLNARLASRAFLPVFHDQLFWASRFKDPLERAWFFEAWERQQTIDWRWLYHRTRITRVGPALRNRQRIWNIFDTIIDILELRWHDIGVPTIPTSDSPRSSSPLEVVGDLWKTYRAGTYSIFHGCRLLHKHYVTIPTDLSRFSISYIQTGGEGYVCGIKFTTVTGDVVQLGYWATTEYSIDVTEIRGFVLAVGSKGIQAVKCLTGSDTSCWLGRPDGIPKTRRLAIFDTPLNLLQVGFDSFKLVSLATDKLPPPIPRKNGLRSLGLWYPDVPDPALSLNESSFFRCNEFLYGCRPLFWTSFGGPGGKYLNHLIQIAVTLLGGMLRIDFEYDIDVPVECRSFGRCQPPIGAQAVVFGIDGPGGEIINAIELDYFTTGPSSTRKNKCITACKACRVKSFLRKTYSLADLL